jgi:hypothetical protein
MTNRKIDISVILLINWLIKFGLSYPKIINFWHENVKSHIYLMSHCRIKSVISIPIHLILLYVYFLIFLFHVLLNFIKNWKLNMIKHVYITI